ncbi:MAG: S9 family peptidase [Bacteroidetes bacterium]|nr:S9 family peptidase [Bacteroidota bacterium]
MRNLFIGIAILFMISCKNKEQRQAYLWPDLKPPVATQKEHLRMIHGDTVNDPYYWMYDYFGKGPDSTAVINYLKEENAYTDSMMTGTKNFREKLFIELKARIKEKDESVPVFDNGYYYYTRTEEGKQYYKYCRKKGSLDAAEEILLDVDQMAEGKPYYSVGGMTVSDDNKLLAYGVDEVSRRQYTLYIKNLETGTIYPDAIRNTQGDPCFAADNKTIFYTANHPVTLLGEKIKKHILGEPEAKDIVVYEEKDKSNYIGVGRSKNKQYILIVSQSTTSSEVKWIAAAQPDLPCQTFAPRKKDVLYDVIPTENKFLIRTNWNAQNFRLMECPLTQTTQDNWKEVIPHRADVLLEGIEPYRDFMVIEERKGGLMQLRVQNKKTGQERFIAFEEPAYAAGVNANPDYESNTLRYYYTSLTTPASIYDYDMNSEKSRLMKQQEVGGGYDKTEYVSERLTATAKDGSRVPISLVYKKGYKKDGQSPLLLYAYGSYGISMDASFSSSRISLLDRGFAFAIAHVRGGEDLGRQWYEDGKLMKKKNTFTDFIDCAQFLIDQKYTNKEHLYAQGGSAGGLLMGAIVTMAPEMWKGVIAQVPFVDVINTMLDESIPLTTNEFEEWGNPKDEAYYRYMKSYSPYENVTKRDYPNILVTTGLHDSQVQYFEPAKWVAKMRALKTDRNVLLLKTDMDFGHGGASGRFDYLKDIAFIYAFVFALEGIQE